MESDHRLSSTSIRDRFPALAGEMTCERWVTSVAVIALAACGDTHPRSDPTRPQGGPSPDTVHAAPRQREIAITFDDLPIDSRALENDTAQRTVTARLLGVLDAHHVPAIGFVNAGRFAPHGVMEPERVAVLAQWIDAGQEIGNH